MFTSKDEAPRTGHRARSVLRRGEVVVGSLGVHRKVHESGRWRMALARILHGEGVVGLRSGHLLVDRRRSRHEEDNRQPEDARHERSDHLDDHRSIRHVVVECGDGSHHGEGYSRVVDRDGHSSRRVVVLHSRHGHDSLLESESDSAHADVGSQIEAGDVC